MKLRNKKTGEIAEWDFGNWYQHILNPDNKESYECTLSEFMDRTAKFREEWEDVPEEPKEDELDNVIALVEAYSSHDSVMYPKEIVEKLKAWKRLKDNGFKFQFWTSSYSGDNISFFIDWINADNKKEVEESLDLLFGGEE